MEISAVFLIIQRRRFGEHMNHVKFCQLALHLPPTVKSLARRESGQAAIFALLLIPVAIVATLLVFNTGQITASKLRVQNAADAAAFSAMELQARQMNLDAYLNRAMLVNEVAIGQAVSILSWSRYVGKVGENIHELANPLKNGSRFIPYIGTAVSQFINTYQKLIETSSSVTKVAGESYANIFLPVANTMDAAYAGAESAFNLTIGISTPNGAVQKTVQEVVALNAPGAEVVAYPLTAAKYWLERRNFVTTWGGQKNPNSSDPGGQARMASMINAGMQPFTSNRAHDLYRPSLLNISLYAAGVDSRKSGGSQLAKNQDGKYIWSGADSFSSDIWYRKYGFFGGKRHLFNKTWAWGGAWSLPSISSFQYYQRDQVRLQGGQDPIVEPRAASNAKTIQMRSYPVYQGAWSHDSRGMNQVVQNFSARLAVDGQNLPLGRGGEEGIARYRDLAWRQRIDPQKGDMTDTAPNFLVLVSLPTKKVKESVTALGVSDDPTQSGQIPSMGWMSMRLDSKGAGKQGSEGVRAVAAAQIYFRRPDALWPRNDGLDERANLFSPFWSVRLVDLTPTEKASIMLINSQS